jgi:hypothetical protein
VKKEIEMKVVFNPMRKAVALAVVTALSAGQAMADVSATLDAVDLTGIATKLAALALLIVGIALAFKGPALAKRIINRV